MTADDRAGGAAADVADGGLQDGDILDLEALFGDGVTLGDVNEPYGPWGAGEDATALAGDRAGAADALGASGSDSGHLAGDMRAAGVFAGRGIRNGADDSLGCKPPEPAAGELVRVKPNGAFGMILGANDDATFDVELLGPDEDEYDVRMPLAGLILQQEAGSEDLTAPTLQNGLLFCRFGVTQGLDVDRSLAACLGRNEHGMIELWYEGGRARAGRMAAWNLEDAQAGGLLGALSTLCTETRDPSAVQAARPTLDACRWSLALFLTGGRAFSAKGTIDDPDAGAYTALRALMAGLSAAGCSCAWKDGVGPCNFSAS